jgi:hypothetical protein
VHALAQRGIDLLVTLDQSLAFEGGAHDDSAPVAAIAVQRDVVAGQALANDGLEFFSGHVELFSF